MGFHGQAATLREYHHRDMCYTYDTTNDSQRVTRRSPLKEAIHGNALYAVCFSEEVIPSHQFPSTHDIAKEGDVVRQTLRINNRIFIHHDVEDGYHYLYLRYHHADNVDMKKMQEDIDKTIRRITRR